MANTKKAPRRILKRPRLIHVFEEISSYPPTNSGISLLSESWSRCSVFGEHIFDAFNDYEISRARMVYVLY